MKRLALVSDAWAPQVNGVVTTLVELVDRLRGRGIEVELIEPSAFRSFPCPGYREIELAWRPAKQVRARLDAMQPEAIHIATEGPLGSAARRWCLDRGARFTTAFHTRFPDILARALHIPERWGYAWFRRFHAPSAGVMVPTRGMLEILRGHGFGNLREWSHGVDLSMFAPLPRAEPPRAGSALQAAASPDATPLRAVQVRAGGPGAAALNPSGDGAQRQAAHSPGTDLQLPRPLFLYVGRVSYEKNLEAFLALDLPGSKLVYGVGPLLERLRRRYPQVHWRGVVPREQLPAIYGAADVFVFPSRSETFGLVMLEAMACGTPVAAYPVAGPLDVIADSDGGVLDTDLRRAALAALDIPRARPRERAMRFDWDAVAEQFISHLVRAQAAPTPQVTDLPQKLHKLAP